MDQAPKFLPLRSPNPPAPIKLPSPSDYVQRVPEFPTTDGSPRNRRLERRRLLRWVGVAVALHATLLLGIYLMPALRIKWEPSRDAWIPVWSMRTEPLPIPQPDLAIPRLDPAAVIPDVPILPGFESDKTPAANSAAPVR